MVKRLRDFPNPLLILAILFGIGLRVSVLADKKILEYDDAFSILAATGHEGEYAEIYDSYSFPLGAWAPAGAWLRMTELEAGRGFGQIAKDLSLYDIHPPLYFWALHSWLYLFGDSLWSTHSLNLLIDLLTAAVLIGFGVQVFGNRSEALLVCAIWILNPVGVKTTFWLRQYTLITLILLLYAFLLFKTIYSGRQVRWRSWPVLALGLTILAGMLTHYYFLIFILVGLFSVAGKFVNQRKERRYWIVLAMLFMAAGLLFLFLFPNFFYAFNGFIVARIAFFSNTSELHDRVRNAMKTSFLLFSPFLIATSLLLAKDFLFYLRRGKGEPQVLGLTWPRGAAQEVHSRRLFRFLTDLASQLRLPVFRWAAIFAIFPFVIILSIYLSGISQVHTFSSRYLGYLTPFVAILTALILRSFKNQPGTIALFALIMTGLGALTLLPGLAQSQQGSIDRASLQQAKFVVLDSAEPGIWPAIVRELNPDQKIFIDSQKNLIAQPQEWFSGPGEEAVLYISIVRGINNTENGKRQILTALADRYRVEFLSEVSRPEDWKISLFRLTPKETSN